MHILLRLCKRLTASLGRKFVLCVYGSESKRNHVSARNRFEMTLTKNCAIVTCQNIPATVG